MKTKLLLLEDDLTLSETVVEYFEEQGFEVIASYDGDDALSAVYENNFDLLLLDVNVPGLNGFEVLKKLREEDNDVPAIFITSLNSVDSLEEGFSSGCDDYIRKPFALKELLLRVQTIIKREYSQKEEFIESLTHDSFIIQIPFIKGHRRTELEKLLHIFEQSSNQTLDKKHILEIDEENIAKRYRPVLRRLIRAIAEPKIREVMQVEDEIIDYIKQHARIAERREKIIEEQNLEIKNRNPFLL